MFPLSTYMHFKCVWTKMHNLCFAEMDLWSMFLINVSAHFAFLSSCLVASVARRMRRQNAEPAVSVALVFY